MSQRPSRTRAGRILRSVRFKIVLLLIVPLVSLSTLWAFAADITLGDGMNLLHVKTIQDHYGYPSGALGSALQDERRKSMVFAGSKAPGDRAAMESGRLVTNRQAELFRRLAADEGAQDAAGAQAKQLASQVVGQLNTLPGKRRAIDSGDVRREQIFSTYSNIITSINALQSSLTTLSDPQVTKDARTQVALTRAREVLAQEDALLAGALAAGRITFAEHVQFTKLVGTQRTLYAEALPDLRPADRSYYERITSTPEFQRLKTLEARHTDHMPRRRPVTGTDVQWKTTASSILTRMRGLELATTAGSEKRAKPIATGIIMRVALAGALGLVAVVASLALSIWVARSVIRELTRLRRTALDLANERLPGVIRRLRRGEEVDVSAEAPPLAFSTDEIDQVGQAFNAARRTAIQGAVEEAKLRRSISEVFLNLARRNQALLHRQLTLLDAMERRIAEPDELEDLFRLDHLATRMRRHAEGLIILSGQAPGRGWRNPVPAIDVARAAAAEVEDYARVTVMPMPRVSVAGPAVADLIHLLAELIENATLFSPPDTTVQVAGQVVAHGFAVEVEDRGLSMDAASLARANERLANPPEFDLSNSAQLGLFVVGRLAQRHSIQVTLRTSPYGGTTAIVLLPGEIVVRGDEQPEIESGRPAITRRAEDALVPVGAIGIAPSRNGMGDTGPMRQITREGRPPLPQRRSAPATVQEPGYDTSYQGRYESQAEAPPEPNPYDSGPVTGPITGPIAATNPYEPPLSPSTGRLDRRSGSAAGQEPSAGYEPVPPIQQEPEPPTSQRRRSVFEPTEADAGAGGGGTGPIDASHTAPGDRPPLPRRVRQASLAPQLRDDTEPLTDATADRSPDELRTMLSSIQKGWLRGRSDAEEAGDHEEEDI